MLLRSKLRRRNIVRETKSQRHTLRQTERDRERGTERERERGGGGAEKNSKREERRKEG